MEDEEQLEWVEGKEKERELSRGVFPRNQEVLRAIEKRQRNDPTGIRDNNTAVGSDTESLGRADLIRRQWQKEGGRSTNPSQLETQTDGASNQQQAINDRGGFAGDPVMDLDEYRKKKELKLKLSGYAYREQDGVSAKSYELAGRSVGSSSKTEAIVDNSKRRKEIANSTLFLMLGVALFYDIVQFVLDLIPIAGWILAEFIALFAFLTFFVWFKLYGRSFTSPKRFSAMAVGSIIEMVPILNGLPGWTVAVILLVVVERGEAALSKVVGVAKFIPGEGAIASKAISVAKKAA
jgi:hypothetical protein